MKRNIPKAYVASLNEIEKMSQQAMTTWLESELNGTSRLLAGQADDYPVQAILNHHRYLDPNAKKAFGQAVKELLSDALKIPRQWDSELFQHLLALSAELPVPSTKHQLVKAVVTSDFQKITAVNQSLILQTIGALSDSSDSSFWLSIAQKFKSFAGLAYQILSRISPLKSSDAIAYLEDTKAVDSVCQRLSVLLSASEITKQKVILESVESNLRTIPQTLQNQFISSLADFGFNIPTPAIKNDHLERFTKKIGICISQICTAYEPIIK